MALQSYRELDVWQKLIELVISAYQLVKQLPDEEKYGLVSQIRRAAVNVPVPSKWNPDYKPEEAS